VKIHIVSQVYLPEPAGTFAADVAERWAERGHDVTVWTATRSPTSGSFEVIGVSRRGAYDRSSLPARAATQLRFSVDAAVAIARQRARTGAPDVVVVVGATASTSAFSVGWFGGARQVHWVYDLYPEALLAVRRDAPLLRALERPIQKWVEFGWRSADAVVAISPLMSDRIRQRVPEARVETIPLWARPEVRHRDDRAPDLRRARGIREDAFVLTYHGNLGLAYDFETFLAGARLLASDPSFVLAVVGAGAQLESVRATVRREGLSNVRFFPPVDEQGLSDSLAMGDCHVVGMREGWNGVAFPSKFISAIAAGRPVVALGPAGTELTDLVRLAECGLAVPPDGASFAAAARRLQADPARARQLGMSGRALYEARFDRELALTRWDELLNSMPTARNR
jgi:glycosyltransferase involved in cell wall biosynthesis